MELIVKKEVARRIGYMPLLGGFEVGESEVSGRWQDADRDIWRYEQFGQKKITVRANAEYLNSLESLLARALTALVEEISGCDACGALACCWSGWGADVESWCHDHAPTRHGHFEDTHANISLIQELRERVGG